MRREKDCKLKVTKNSREWVCDFCGSEKLNEKVWVNLNEEAVIDGELYVKYVEQADDNYWCDGCNEEAIPIPYEQYKEKEDEE